MSHSSGHAMSRGSAGVALRARRSYSVSSLVDVGYGKHLRVDHGRNEFAKGKTHINGIVGFWGFAKPRLARFRGMRKATFYLHLKECEFRFNSRGDTLMQDDSQKSS